jgi:hypothetical protein
MATASAAIVASLFPSMRALRRTAVAIQSATTTPVIAKRSGEPASIWAARARPRRTAVRPDGTAMQRSAASSTHGIQDAPARWCQTLTSERSGPEAMKIAPAAAAAPSERPVRRASREAPRPPNRTWPNASQA